jgi:AhpD family alkylhydroperoxidase
MTMPDSFKQAAEARRPHRVALHRGLREVMKHFAAFDNAVMAEGALSFKQKELIAVAVSVALRCDDCIGIHVEQAVKAGANRDEITEALGVAILMSGGPGVQYATHAIAALAEHEDEPQGGDRAETAS